jgi:hypothetical protein
VRELLLLLHVLATATWLGAALWTPGDVRRTLALGRPQADALAARAGPALRLDLGAGIASIVTGLAILLWDGGHPRLGIQVGLVLSVVRLLVVWLGMLPTWRRIAARIASGEDLAGAEPGARRMGMFSGIAHTLWVLALAGMVFPY